MPVTVDTGGKMYRLREGGEWGSIFVKPWENAHAFDEHKSWGVLVMCHTSYGSYSYSWSSCGTPHTEFLPDLDFDYLMGKFDAESLREFDREGTKAILLASVCRQRLDTYLDKHDARRAYNFISHMQASTPEEFMREWNDADPQEETVLRVVSTEPYEYFMHRPSHQARGFFDKIWKPFTKFLKEENA